MYNPLAGVEALRAVAEWSKFQDEYLWDDMTPADIIQTYHMVKDLPYTGSLKNLLTQPIAFFNRAANESEIEAMDTFRSWFSGIKRIRNGFKIKL